MPCRIRWLVAASLCVAALSAHYAPVVGCGDKVMMTTVVMTTMRAANVDHIDDERVSKQKTGPQVGEFSLLARWAPRAISSGS